MIELLIVLTCVSAGVAVLHLALREPGAAAPERSGSSPVACFLDFVRAAEPRLARLTDDRLLELGRGTCASLRDYRGDADLVVAEALASGASLDVILPVVVGAGFFLAPEFTGSVQQIARRRLTLA
jgi:hypothetical protein